MLDATAFVGRWPFYSGACGDAAGLLAMMDKEGIEKALVSPLGSVFLKDPEEGNKELWREAEQGNDRLLAAPCVNPTYPGWRGALDRWAQRGAAAIRTHPNYHSYAANGAAMRALAAACGGRHLPLIVTMRLQDERQHHPAVRVPAVKAAEIAELARYCDEPTRLLVSFARLGEILALQRLLQRARPLWYDVAGVQGPERMWEQLTNAQLGHRLVFGSGWPLQYESVATAKVAMMEMDTELRGGLLSRNLLDLLQHPRCGE